MSDEDGKDEVILEELRKISDKHSVYNRSKRKAGTLPLSSLSASAERKTENGIAQGDLDSSEANKFLSQTGENSDLNQYWYSKNTIETICNAIREGLSISGGHRVAFLSTPSLFFSLSPQERGHCVLFDVS